MKPIINNIQRKYYRDLHNIMCELWVKNFLMLTLSILNILTGRWNPKHIFEILHYCNYIDRPKLCFIAWWKKKKNVSTIIIASEAETPEDIINTNDHESQW
jgi:hypothetical protein